MTIPNREFQKYTPAITPNTSNFIQNFDYIEKQKEPLVFKESSTKKRDEI